MTEIKIFSPAKLNLSLLIREKRPDGYHDIETIFIAINLFDQITISLKGRGIKILTDNPEIPTGEENLAYRAATFFYKNLGKSYGTEVFIENHIPPGRGLGGASSNAVATLIGLNLLFGRKFKKKELFALAKELGSDCPFFLFGGACYARGRGEILEPIKIPKLKFFLYLP
ncbi:MAG: 4-(cytidine 5'-diphospho)-2-C-methyl-D-erythritol kinase, partial [candidate division WOR-3 bacterium]